MQGLSVGWNSRKLGGCHHDVVNPSSVVACHNTHTLPALLILKHIPKHLVEPDSVLCSVFGVSEVQEQRWIVCWLSESSFLQ